VKLANAFLAASGRRVDWIHIPLLDTTDEAFFAPLAQLEPGGARVYLGAIHNMERFGERVALAQVPAGVQACRLLRLRPQPGSSCPASSTII
jgi:hypothetical protein